MLIHFFFQQWQEIRNLKFAISMNYSRDTALNHCPACIHHYNNLIPVNPLASEFKYISTVRELTTPSKGTMLHGMDEVD